MEKISIVTSLYNSSPFIHEFYNRCLQAIAEINCDYEFIFVNDGSPDNSLETVLALAKDPKVIVVDFSRNFGHHKAIMTGLKYATGDYIFTLDSDLEEPPELLTQFYKKIKTERDLDVVFGVRKQRKDPFFTRLLAKSFYYVFEKLSGIKNLRNVMIMRLMSKRYLQALLQHDEKNIFIVGLFHIVGFKQGTLEIEKPYKGYTNYTLSRRILLAIDGITSFSVRPLYYIAVLGFIVSICSFLAAIYTVYRKFAFGTIITGWASLSVSIWILGGLILFSIGIVGIYISRIFEDVKNRPLSVVRKMYNRDQLP